MVTGNKSVPKIIINYNTIHFFKLQSAFSLFQTITVSGCSLIKLLPYILFKKYINILALKMASPGNQHCVSCIGTLSFHTMTMFYLKRLDLNTVDKSPDWDSGAVNDTAGFTWNKWDRKVKSGTSTVCPKYSHFSRVRAHPAHVVCLRHCGQTDGRGTVERWGQRRRSSDTVLRYAMWPAASDIRRRDPHSDHLSLTDTRPSTHSLTPAFPLLWSALSGGSAQTDPSLRLVVWLCCRLRIRHLFISKNNKWQTQMLKKRKRKRKGKHQNHKSYTEVNNCEKINMK